MAQQAVLEVSLKDYKAKIDELRASLLNLESTSEEYGKIADEVRGMQEKLNEVMGVGKEKADGVDGSYNQLSQTLSKLKKEWKTLEIGSEQWTALGQQIDEINTKLKDADASVGVFSRNVGNYSKSFEDAFKSMLPSLGNISPELGKVGSMLSRMIPVIKSVNATATAGLKGIKAAIASTGIGALVIAFGALTHIITKNWDAIKDWILGISKAKTAYEDFKKSVESADAAHKQYIEYLKGTGASAMQLQVENLKYANQQLEKEKIMLEELQALGRKGRKMAEEQRKREGDAARESEEQWQALNNSLNAFITEQEKLERQKGMSELEKKLDDVDEAFDDAIEGAKELAAVTGDDTWLAAAIQHLEELRAAAQARARSDAGKSIWKSEEEEIKRRSKEIADATKTEIQLLEDKYKKELALFKKHHKDTMALTTQYNLDRQKLEIKAAQETRDTILSIMQQLSSGYTRDALTQELENAKTAAQEFYDIIGRNNPPEPPLENAVKELTEAEVEAAHNAGLIATKTKTELAAAWVLVFEKVQAAERKLRNFNEGLVEVQKEMEEVQYDNQLALAKLVDGTDEYIQASIEGTQKLIEKQQEYISVLESIEEPTEEQEKALKQARLQLEGMNSELRTQLSLQKQIALERKQQAADTAAAQANMNTDTSGMWNNTNFAAGYAARIQAAQTYYDIVREMQYNSDEERIAAETEAQQQLLDIQREYNEQRIANYSELVQHIGSIFGSMADLYAQDIANQVKNNKMGQKEAEAQYKKVQALKVSEAIIQTISGALAAFMGYQALGQPWGGILGTVAAAAVTAAGMAQVAQIKAQNPYGSSTPTSASYVVPQPQQQEYNPEYFSNITGAQDTAQLANALADNPVRAYVVESEVNAAQEVRRRRDEETTY